MSPNCRRYGLLAALFVSCLLRGQGTPPLLAQEPPAAPEGQGVPAAPEPEQKKRSLWDRITQKDGAEQATAASTTTTASTTPAAKDGATLEAEARAKDAARSVASSQALLRQGPLATDPEAVRFMDLIDTNQATAATYNDFAAYLGRKGYLRIAAQYQQVATRLDPKNPTVWVNLGILQREINLPESAIGSFRKAVQIDPSHAFAHYNLGMSYDARGDYDNAIRSYRAALTLDPGLADPRKNPLVVRNERLLAVQLMLFQAGVGAQGLPLKEMEPKPAKGKKGASSTSAPH